MGWKVLDGSICRTNASELFGLAKLCLKGLQNYKPRPSPAIASQELNFYTLHPPKPTPSMLVATSSAITMTPMMSVTVSCCTGLSIALSTNMPLRNVSQDVHPQNKHLRFSFRRTQQIPPFPIIVCCAKYAFGPAIPIPKPLTIPMCYLQARTVH